MFDPTAPNYDRGRAHAKVTGRLKYRNDDRPDYFPDTDYLDRLKPLNDFTLQPYDNMTRLREPDKNFTLTAAMQVLDDGKN